VVGELAQWSSQHSLMGVGSGFSGELYSECWQTWWCLNQTRIWRGPHRVQVEPQPFGVISTFRLALIRGISDGTKVSGSDDQSVAQLHTVFEPKVSA